MLSSKIPVYTEMPIKQPLGHQLTQIIQLFGLKTAFAQLVYFCFGQAENFAQLAHHGFVLKGVVGGQQRGVGEAVEDVLGNIIAVFPAKINVKIRRSCSMPIRSVKQSC